MVLMLALIVCRIIPLSWYAHKRTLAAGGIVDSCSRCRGGRIHAHLLLVESAHLLGERSYL